MKFVALNQMKDVSVQQCYATATRAQNTAFFSVKRKSFGSVRPVKYKDAVDFVESTVATRWDDVNPVSRKELYRILVRHFDPTSVFSFAAQVMRGKNFPNSMHKFVERTLDRIGFTERKASISQKVPANWKNLAIAGAKRCPQQFIEEGVEAILAADEAFILFHETDTSLITPVGVKRVGTAPKKDVNDGCTLMVTMDMAASRLTQPLSHFEGRLVVH
ncbi:hypothetical protein GN958_ATG04992 [Phytophthora infestans]|uniref:Uncharacterized protein n=1 Tax=Phytophthora infestans TaxID=4787 RepID=A0A8S9V5L6_PHYIN|nr:hypothetical protein GN958_ATG04992 [Phytophthora infestans]